MSKHKCSVCNIAVKAKDKSLFCEMCEVWKHIKCDDVKEDTYIMMNQWLNDEDTNDQRLHWFCADCNEKAIKGIKMVICLEKRTAELETQLQKINQSITDLQTEKMSSNDVKEMLDSTLTADNEKIKKLIKDEVVVVIAEEPEFVDANDEVGSGENAVEALRSLGRSEMTVRNEVKQLFEEEMNREYQLTVDDMVGKMKEQIVKEITEKANLPAVNVLSEDTVLKIKNDIIQEVKAETQAVAVIDEGTVSKMKDDILKEVAEKQSYAAVTNNNLQSDADANTVQITESQWQTVAEKYVSKAMNRQANSGKRENNIILYRIEEKDDQDDAKVADRMTLVELLTTCSVTEGLDAVEEYKRIGAKAVGKERPILLKFKDLEAKIRLYKNLRNLQNAEAHLKIISVDHDKTAEERQATKNLVAEAKKREEADPTHRYRVRGPPGNQRIAQLPLVGASA